MSQSKGASNWHCEPQPDELPQTVAEELALVGLSQRHMRRYSFGSFHRPGRDVRIDYVLIKL